MRFYLIDIVHPTDSRFNLHLVTDGSIMDFAYEIYKGIDRGCKVRIRLSNEF